MIRKRREASGYGTYSKKKDTMAPTGDKNFSNPRNSMGQVTKRTKQLAHAVDQELLED